jgi:hypothetical protein
MEDRREIYDRTLRLWRRLCELEEEVTPRLLLDRSLLVRACATLGAALPEGRRLFRNIPPVRDAEGPHPRKSGALVRGKLAYTYGSVYEFHLEYPIAGWGVRKDLISVVEPDGTRRPLLEWLREEDLVVWCGRCGLEITCEVSRRCPARGLRGRTLRPRLSPRED